MSFKYKSILLICSLPLLISTLSLTGCSGAATLGMTTQQWQQLSPAEQQQDMNHYHEIISNLKQKKVTAPSSTNNSTDDDIINTDAIVDPSIELTITKASAAFPNQFWPLMNITPLHVSLNPNTCTSHVLQNVNQNQSTTLWFCYINHMVGIDPSFYQLSQAWGTLFININPLWNQGMLYNHLYSSGYVKLNDASIYIKADSPVTMAPKTIDITQKVDADSTNIQPNSNQTNNNSNTTTPINTLTNLNNNEQSDDQ